MAAESSCMAEPNASPGGDEGGAVITPGVKRDPLRPSARRVVWLVAGAALSLMMFGVGFALGLTPIHWQSHIRQRYIERALAQDTTIDFASADWRTNVEWGPPWLPGDTPSDYLGEGSHVAIVVVTLLVLAPFVLAAMHIMITWLAAAMALRADRRLNLGLGSRPALVLAADVMVRVLFTRVVPLCLVCGVFAGVFHLGHAVTELGTVGFDWLPSAGVAFSVGMVVLGDCVHSVGVVRSRLQSIAPVEARVCNDCGYSLRGLPGSAESCPECGRALLANRTIVSMLVSQSVGRVATRAIVVAAILLAVTCFVLFAYVGGVRAVVVQWAKAGAHDTGSGNTTIIARDGTVVRATVGGRSVYFTARSSHGRAVEIDPATGTWRRWDETPPTMRRSLWFISSPIEIHSVEPWREGVFFAPAHIWSRNVSATIMFATPDELPPDDWAWLTEPFDAGESMPVAPEETVP